MQSFSRRHSDTRALCLCHFFKYLWLPSPDARISLEISKHSMKLFVYSLSVHQNPTWWRLFSVTHGFRFRSTTLFVTTNLFISINLSLRISIERRSWHRHVHSEHSITLNWSLNYKQPPAREREQQSSAVRIEEVFPSVESLTWTCAAWHVVNSLSFSENESPFSLSVVYGS